jgi:hypothetical protein
MAKRTPTGRRLGGVIALLVAGWFIHDAVLHAVLVVYGMNWLLGMEFSLPDLSATGVSPDRMIQAFALLFALAAASIFLWVGLRSWRR